MDAIAELEFVREGGDEQTVELPPDRLTGWESIRFVLEDVPSG